MKKAFLMLAAMSVLLSSCTEKVPEKDIDTVQPETDAVENNDKDKDEALQKGTEAQNDVVSKNVFKIDGELPDIGSFSGKKERFYKEYTPYFIPSEEYGQIVPYVGNYKMFSLDGMQTDYELGYSNYGFCTSDGKIVMDASAISRHISYTKTDDGFGFYTLSVMDDPANETEDDVFMPQKTFVIPESGEWCLELKDNCWVNGAMDGIISVSSYSEAYDSGECIFYDYNGNEIKRLKGYDNIILAGHGLIGVMKWDDEPMQAYTDTNGNIVLGPYKAINSFNGCGIAVIEDEDGHHLIDTNGNVVTKMAYANISWEGADKFYDTNGVFTARHFEDKNKSDVFNAKGEYITTISGKAYFNFRFASDGEIIYWYNDSLNSDDLVWKRLSDGSELICREYGKRSNSYGGAGDYFIYKDIDSDEGCIFDTNGDTVVKARQLRDIMCVSDDGRFILYSCGEVLHNYNKETDTIEYSGKITSYLYDKEKKETVVQMDGEQYGQFVGKDDRYIILQSYDSFDPFSDIKSCLLYDTQSGKKLCENSSMIEYTDSGKLGYFNVCTENSCAVYDGDMKLVMRTYNE